jgi:hypothetical protein
LVVGPVEEVDVVCRPVSLLLPQAAVWVVVVDVVVVCVKPAFELGGFVTSDVVVLVVVPQSLTLSAWAAGESPPTAVNAARVVETVRFLSDIGLLLSECRLNSSNVCDCRDSRFRGALATPSMRSSSR